MDCNLTLEILSNNCWSTMKNIISFGLIGQSIYMLNMSIQTLWNRYFFEYNECTIVHTKFRRCHICSIVIFSTMSWESTMCISVSQLIFTCIIYIAIDQNSANHFQVRTYFIKLKILWITLFWPFFENNFYF